MIYCMDSARRLSAFDLDHTLFKDNSSYCFGVYLYQQGRISLTALLFIIFSKLRYKWGFLSLAQLHQQAFEFIFRGYSLPVLEKCVTDFLDVHFDQLIYEPAFQKLKMAQRNGEMVAILSSSPAFLVEPIAKRFGVSVWQATQYAIDKDQKFCHIAHLMLGGDKASFIEDFMHRNKLAKGDVVAYSDSFDDLPFLLSAGTAVGVNPDRKLRSFCKNHHWSII